MIPHLRFRTKITLKQERKWETATGRKTSEQAYSDVIFGTIRDAINDASGA
jgi:hypothetical protein